MTITIIPFILNHKPGTLQVRYKANSDAITSGFEIFAARGFDVERCIGYPTMHARLGSYEGAGYANACGWIQIVTRREYAAWEAAEPAAVVSSVDTHPMLEELGVPFFAFGFPAEIFDAPCDNLNGSARLDWLADTFLVTLPTRANDYSISRVAGFCWGYSESDCAGKLQIEIKPLVVTAPAAWDQYLPLLRNSFSHWKFNGFCTGMERNE